MSDKRRGLDISGRYMHKIGHKITSGKRVGDKSDCHINSLRKLYLLEQIISVVRAERWHVVDVMRARA